MAQQTDHIGDINEIVKTETAIQWLEYQLHDIIGDLSVKKEIGIMVVDAIEKAKQMHKEQIIEAFKEGYINGALEDNEYKGDDYFNETFEK